MTQANINAIPALDRSVIRLRMNNLRTRLTAPPLPPLAVGARGGDLLALKEREGGRRAAHA